MRNKSLLSSLLVLGMIVTTVPVNTLAASDTATVDYLISETKVADTEGLSEKKLTELVTSIKKKINIPTEYSIFDYYYSAESAYSNERWSFTWNNNVYTKSITIYSDEKGNILSYNRYSSMTDTEEPKYLKNELKSKADAFIKQVDSKISGKIAYNDSYFSNGYQKSYVYRYMRMEQGIPMPQQQISIGVSVATGEVISYDNGGWNYEISIPAKKVELTKEQATSKISEQVKMNLVYHSRYNIDEPGNGKKKAYLVYEPSLTYISIDAAKGTSYTTLSEWNLDEGMKNEASEKMYDSAAGNAGLTQAEIKKISEVNGLISKEKAVEIITKNKSLYLNSEEISINASLKETTDYWNNNVKRYVWSIQLSKPNEDKSYSYIYPNNTSASVDAKTGEIIYFNANYKDFYTAQNDGTTINQKVNFTEEQSKNIFETFVKTQNKDRFAKTKLATTSNQYVINVVKDKEVYGGYQFNYDRVNEGIPYSDNQIYGSVDAVTGKVVSYGYYWDDSIEFESPKGVITPKVAFENFMKFEGYELVYELNTIHKANSFTQEARLVYRMDIFPSYVSPFTGKQVNYDGLEYSKTSSNQTYTDIKNHKYYRSIQMITDMGVVFEGSKFNPDQAITKSEFQQMVDTVTYFYSQEKLSGTGKLTRQAAAMYAMELLNLDKVAKLKGIYKVGSADEKQITSTHVGAVALAKGLGLLSVNKENKILPKANLTRAEAADMVLKIITVK